MLIEKYLQQFDEEFAWLYRNISKTKDPIWVLYSPEVKTFFKQSLTDYGNELIDKIPDAPENVEMLDVSNHSPDRTGTEILIENRDRQYRYQNYLNDLTKVKESLKKLLTGLTIISCGINQEDRGV